MDDTPEATFSIQAFAEQHDQEKYKQTQRMHRSIRWEDILVAHVYHHINIGSLGEEMI